MGSITAAVAASAINCWAAAGVRYDLPVDLLFAIGQVESGHRVDARGNNKDGSRDLGVMQINSRWLPLLAEYRISEQDLLTNPCTNIQVGAWILAQEVQRTGYSWESIGAYNAGPLAADASCMRSSMVKRSTPSANPTPGIGGPPNCSTRPS